MQKLLIIGYVWPEPESSAAGSHMMQLISFFLRKGYRICFATTAARTPYMADLGSMGVMTESIELNNKSFDTFLANFSPEVVVFDRFMMEEQFGWRVSSVCPQAIRILDTEDLHFLRKARQVASMKNLLMTTPFLQTDFAKREIASMYRCDLSLIISEAEMKLLREEFNIPEFLLFYLPLVVMTSEPVKALPSFDERRNFVSMGNFRHEPNWDAVLYLKKSIWPLIKKELPEAELHIYGAYPTKKAFQLQNPQEKFLIKGRAESAREVIKNSRLLLAPIRFGAGIKGKFIDAMAVGTPSLTTIIGAEAMAGNLPWCGSIQESPGEFAKAAVALYSHPMEWKEAQRNGFEILQKRFSSGLFEVLFDERIDSLRENLLQHREQNFIGTMLQHHLLNSTRYLSKYIEIKNKLEDCVNSKSAR